MALSDYERRVLAEIEVELGDALSPRRGRVRAIAVLACCLLGLAGVTALCALLLPAAAAAGLCSAGGVVVGFTVCLLRERHRHL